MKHLISRTLDQPTWVPGGDHTFGYAREGQNSVVREIKTRIERAKNGKNQDQIQEEKKGEGLIADTPITDEPKNQILMILLYLTKEEEQPQQPKAETKRKSKTLEKPEYLENKFWDEKSGVKSRRVKQFIQRITKTIFYG